MTKAIEPVDAPDIVEMIPENHSKIFGMISSCRARLKATGLDGKQAHVEACDAVAQLLTPPTDGETLSHWSTSIARGHKSDRQTELILRCRSLDLEKLTKAKPHVIKKVSLDALRAICAGAPYKETWRAVLLQYGKLMVWPDDIVRVRGTSRRDILDCFNPEHPRSFLQVEGWVLRVDGKPVPPYPDIHNGALITVIAVVPAPPLAKKKDPVAPVVPVPAPVVPAPTPAAPTPVVPAPPLAKKKDPVAPVVPAPPAQQQSLFAPVPGDMVEQLVTLIRQFLNSGIQK